MSKVFTFVTVVLGVMATLAMLGIADSSTSQLLQGLSWDNPQSFTAADFFSLVFGSSAGVISLLAAASAITIGLFARTSYDSVIIAGFAGLLAGWVAGDMYSIMAVSTTWAPDFPFFAKVVKLYFFVFIGSFIVAMVSWWRGAD